MLCFRDSAKGPIIDAQGRVLLHCLQKRHTLSVRTADTRIVSGLARRCISVWRGVCTFDFPGKCEAISRARFITSPPATGTGTVLPTQDAVLPDVPQRGGGSGIFFCFALICIPLNIHEAEHLFIYVWAT